MPDLIHVDREPAAAPTADDPRAFERQLIVLIPQMRAFARSLCKDATAADDLAQDALAKAWKSRGSYQMGSNMKAWAFMILRNQFLSEKRRSWRLQQLDPELAERTLVAVDNPDATVALDEVRQALATLPFAQREALIMVGAGGLSYDEAAEVTGVATGTMKSRVSRARVALQHALDSGRFRWRAAPAATAASDLMAQLAAQRRPTGQSPESRFEPAGLIPAKHLAA